MPLDLQEVRDRAKKASNEDLLDRVTVYRTGMDPDAVEVLLQELHSRGVTDEQVRQHRESREREVIWDQPGLALRCSFCDRPAVRIAWRWHRLFGLVPLFPFRARCCRQH